MPSPSPQFISQPLPGTRKLYTRSCVYILLIASLLVSRIIMVRKTQRSRKAYQKQYYEQTKGKERHVPTETKKERNREAYKARLKSILESRRKCYSEHSEEEKEARRERYQESSEKEKLTRMQCYKANADKERCARMQCYEADSDREKATCMQRYTVHPLISEILGTTPISYM